MENSNTSDTNYLQPPVSENKKDKKSNKIWKIITIILTIIIILLLLTQCQCLKNCYFPNENTDLCNDNQSSTQTNNSSKNLISNTETKECSYLGTWTRTGTFVNGDLISTTPSTMNLYEESYHSETDLCFTEGTLTVSGLDMNMKIDNSDCPTGSIPTSYDYTYALECDGTNPLHLTFTIDEQGSTIVENYDWVK